MGYRTGQKCYVGLQLMLVIELVSKWEICWGLWSLVLFFVWSGLTTPTDPNNVMWFLMGDFLSLSQSAHGLSLRKSPIKNHVTLFGSGRVVKLDQIKLGSTKPNKSPIWRLVQSPKSTAILQNTIPHPCNSSSYPQARRPIKAAHSFKFSIVTPLVNMSARFLNPQIFLSIISLSSTR